MTQENREMLESLLNDAGVSEAKARERLADPDLWVIHPHMRWGGETPEETIEGFRRAADDLRAVSEMLMDMGKKPAWMLVQDQLDRIDIAVERAKERAKKERR